MRYAPLALAIYLFQDKTGVRSFSAFRFIFSDAVVHRSAQALTRISQVIDELGLGKVADQKVGNEMVRGVSGGERKRVNIGMELITSPRCPRAHR